MKRFCPLLLIMLVATASAVAQDTIVLKNGDVLTGTILQQDAEHLSFESESFGSVNLDPSDIAEIRTGSPNSGEVAAATEREPAPPSAPAPDPVPQAASTPPTAPGKWSGQAGLSIAMREKTRSNSVGVYSEESFEVYRLYGNIAWKGDKNQLDWNWTYRYSEDESIIRDDYLNIAQKYNRNFKGGYYAEAKTIYQRDHNRQIENEYLQTAELGVKWINRPPKLQLSTSIGGGYHQYERDETSTSQPKFIFDESFRWQMINSLVLFQKYTHLGDLDKYHFVFASGLENKLIKEVFLRLEYRLDRDTETAYDNTGYYDKALLTSLLYKF